VPNQAPFFLCEPCPKRLICLPFHFPGLPFRVAEQPITSASKLSRCDGSRQYGIQEER